MAKDSRVVVTMECAECKARIHHTEKRVKGQDVIKRLEMKKNCPTCKKAVMHKETK